MNGLNLSSSVSQISRSVSSAVANESVGGEIPLNSHVPFLRLTMHSRVRYGGANKAGFISVGEYTSLKGSRSAVQQFSARSAAARGRFPLVMLEVLEASPVLQSDPACFKHKSQRLPG